MNGSHPTPPRQGAALTSSAVAVAVTMLALDLVWLGIVAKDLYETSLGPLKSPKVNVTAAGLFYTFYVAAIVVHAVRGASGPAEAARRGAGLGLVAYGTYELTNWAVLRDWPARLVPVDIVWGTVLTAVAGYAGRWVYDKVLKRQ